jgi:urate oxidase
VQETAYNMATEVLRRFPMVQEVFLATPNIHHYPYPLEQFGLTNNNDVFQSTDCVTTASGRIETHVVRAAAKL